VTLAVASIVTYMSMNGLTDKDISLVDACYRSVQASGINSETCDDFKKMGQDWDTKIPCVELYKEDIYYYTPRMMFMYYAGGKQEIGNLGRRNKGSANSAEPLYTAANNLTFIEALNDRCEEMMHEPEYLIFLEYKKQFDAGVEASDIDLSMFEDRNLYGWTDFTNWVVSYFGFAFQTLVIIWTQPVSDGANYKACSIGYGLQKAFLNKVGINVQDHAECSGRTPHHCARWHHNGPHGWWNNHGIQSRNHLNRGCVAHDKCLKVTVGAAKGECDDDLASASWPMLRWKWPGINCSWRGCRTWLFAWRTATADSRRSAILVWCTMAWKRPNGN
jgi:hypothetical protein